MSLNALIVTLFYRASTLTVVDASHHLIEVGVIIELTKNFYMCASSKIVLK